MFQSGHCYTATADLDDDPLKFSLTGADADFFSIETDTGHLSTAISINYEDKSTYVLGLHVSDGLSSDQKALEIKIVDVNDLQNLQQSLN